MPYRQIPLETRWTVANLLQTALELTQLEIASATGVSESTVHRIQHNLFHYGQPDLPAWVKDKPGRPGVLGEAMEEFAMAYVDACPHALLQEVAVEVELEFNIEIHPKVIERLLKRRNYSRKVAIRVAQEQNAELREAWRVGVNRHHPKQIVCLDESASNERTGWRKYAWAPRGFRASMGISRRR